MAMLTTLSPEALIPADHPIRRIRVVVDAVLEELDDEFDAMYARSGRPSVPPEQLLKATLTGRSSKPPAPVGESLEFRLVVSRLNLTLMRIPRRAESAVPRTLVETFVNVGPLFDLLSGRDHQVLYGRRGTGKTHALLYLAEQVRNNGDKAVYIDIRTIGSSGGLYADPTLPIQERGTRLMIDILEALHDDLVSFVLDSADDPDINLAQGAFSLLDQLANEITSVRIEGPVERERTAARETESETEHGLELGLSQTGVGLGGRTRTVDVERQEAINTERETGVVRHRVHFGALHRVLQELVKVLPSERVWVLLDEWSEIPFDLQPLIADLLKRALLPVRGLTVKIGAIEQRSEFRAQAEAGGFIGIELGADATADIDLDDFMVFGNDAGRAREFFAELLVRHIRSALDEQDDQEALPTTATALIRGGFTQAPVFDELVKAAEGVPRDAINVSGIAARLADDDQIGMNHVRRAARQWFQQDKEAAASANPTARDLLNWVIDKVIGERRARAFLLQQGEAQRHPLIRSLYDARVLHVVKRGVAARDQPGVRFDVYALDYGCYVELIATARSPEGLFEAETDDGAAGYVEVPADDYRSIRRGILNLDEFEEAVA